MPRKITKKQLAMAEALTYKLAEVETEMDNLWFAVDSNHPSDAQLAVLIELIGTVHRTLRSMVVQNGGSPHA